MDVKKEQDNLIELDKKVEREQNNALNFGAEPKDIAKYILALDKVKDCSDQLFTALSQLSSPQ